MAIDFSKATPMELGSPDDSLNIASETYVDKKVDFTNAAPIQEEEIEVDVGKGIEIEDTKPKEIPSDPLAYGFQLREEGKVGSRIYKYIKDAYPDINDSDAVDIAFRKTSSSNKLKEVEEEVSNKMAYAQALQSPIEDLHDFMTKTPKEQQDYTRGQYEMVGSSLVKDGVIKDYSSVDGTVTTLNGQVIPMTNPSFLQSMKANGYELASATLATIGTALATRSPSVSAGASALGGGVGRYFDLKDIEKELDINISDSQMIKKVGLASAEDLIGSYVGGKMLEFSSDFGKAIYNKITNPEVKKNIIEGKATFEQTRDYLLKEFGLTPEKENFILSNYRKLTNKTNLTEAEKIKALVLAQDKNDAVKMLSNYYSEGALAQVAKDQTELVNSFLKTIDAGKKDSIQALADITSKKLETLGKNYGDIKKALIENYNDIVKIKPEDLSMMKKEYLDYVSKKGLNATQSTLDLLDKGISKGLEFDELIKLRIDLGQTQMSAKGGDVKGVRTLKNFIDENIIGSIKERNPAEADIVESLWKTANVEYSAKKLLDLKSLLGKDVGGKDANWISHALLKISGKEMSPKAFGEYVGKAPLTETGQGVFNQLKEVLGQDVMERVESSMVKSAIELKEGSLPEALKVLSNFDFSTQAGVQLQKRLKAIVDVVPSNRIESAISKYFDGKNMPAVLTDSLFSKAKWFIVGRVWHGMMKRSPYYKKARIYENISESLTSPMVIVDVKKATNKALEYAFKEERKAIKDKIKHMQQVKMDAPNIAEANQAKIHIAELANQIKQLKEIKESIPQYTDKDLAKARRLQLDMANKQVAIDKRLEMIDDLEVQYQKALDSGKGNIESIEKRLDRERRYLEIDKKRHSALSDNYDKTGVPLEDLELNPREQAVPQQDYIRVGK